MSVTLVGMQRQYHAHGMVGYNPEALTRKEGPYASSTYRAVAEVQKDERGRALAPGWTVYRLHPTRGAYGYSKDANFTGDVRDERLFKRSLSTYRLAAALDALSATAAHVHVYEEDVRDVIAGGAGETYALRVKTLGGAAFVVTAERDPVGGVWLSYAVGQPPVTIEDEQRVHVRDTVYEKLVKRGYTSQPEPVDYEQVMIAACALAESVARNGGS